MSTKTITTEEVRKVAGLARLALSDEEAKQYQAQLSNILSYVAQLDEVDVSDIEPAEHAALKAARADVVLPSLSRDEVLAQAPASEAGGIAVPKVMDGN